MATRKVKRYDEGGATDTEFGDLEGAIDAANAREVRAQFDANERANAAPKAAPKVEAKAAPAAKAETKSAPAAKADSKGSGFTTMTKEAGDAARAKFRESSKPAESKPKKEMYRTFGGEFKEKSTEPDVASRMGDAIGRGARSVGSAIADYGRSLLKNPKSNEHGTYKTTDEKGKDKIVRYAKGGTSASSRADGIASRGKTRGKIC